MKKTKEQIRKETPLSVTGTDNAIYEVHNNPDYPIIYETFEAFGVRWNDTVKDDQGIVERATISNGDRLRVLQCFDDDQPNHYRWGDGNQFIIIPDEYMKYISGDVQFRGKENK